MSALGVVLTKKITKQVDKNVIMFYLGVGTVVCGFIGLFGFGAPSNPPAWEWALSLGSLSHNLIRDLNFSIVDIETNTSTLSFINLQIYLIFIDP